MIYNKLRYLQLRKKAEDLEKKNISFLEQDKDQYLELLQHEGRLADQIFWENNRNYVSIINDFITEKLTAEDFVDAFFNLWNKDMNKAFVNLDPDIESQGFSKWIGRIFEPCELFEPELEENKIYTEKWLRDSIANLFIQIQKEYDLN